MNKLPKSGAAPPYRVDDPISLPTGWADLRNPSSVVIEPETQWPGGDDHRRSVHSTPAAAVTSALARQLGAGALWVTDEEPRAPSSASMSRTARGVWWPVPLAAWLMVPVARPPKGDSCDVQSATVALHAALSGSLLSCAVPLVS
jgi:hypothetical protein